jgi:predicted RNA binding protein YcfA (HicA-like mRNA interferase family)
VDLERELEELRTRKRSVRPEELHKLLLAAGFTRRFGKGDHWKYSHPKLAEAVIIDPRNPLLVAYVVSGLKAIEKVMRLEDR